MPLLGSLVTHLILAVTLVLAAAVAGIMAYHYAKARLREKRGYAFDPVAEEAVPPGPVEQRAKSAEEITEIRARIEALMEQQHIRSETENQHLAQKLDEIRTHMNTQDRKFDGLKSELRHEIHRRDGELDELRHQLASALDAFWKSMPALPEETAPHALPPAHAAAPAEATAVEAEAASSPSSASSTPAVAEPDVMQASVDAAAQEAAAASTATDEPQRVEAAREDDPAREDEQEETSRQFAPADPEPAERGAYVTYEDASPVEEATFVEVRFEEDAYEEEVTEPVASVAATRLADRTVEDAAPPPPVREPAAPPATPPAATPEASAPLSWEAPFAGGDGAATGDGVPSDPPTASHAPAPPADAAPPIEGDDLTVISSITPEIQRALYAAGVTSLEGIARWSRADARRTSGLLGVPEDVIMHQWIFEAQSVLFEQYQALMTQEA